jgi:hypothetical protein
LATSFDNAFSNTAVPTVNIAPALVADAPKSKKHGWLPVLTVLFLISYGLMTMLIIEQGQTIESQRALIKELFRDSSELSAARKAQQEKTVADPRRLPAAKAPTTQTPSSQTPTNQTPSNQVPAKQSPSSQAAPQHGPHSQTTKDKQEFHMPSKPAPDLVDDKRAQIAI